MLNHKIFSLLYIFFLSTTLISCNQSNNENVNNQSSLKTYPDSLKTSIDLPNEVQQLNKISIIDSSVTPETEIEFREMFSVGDSIGPGFISHLDVDNQGRIYLGYGSAIRGKKKIFVFDDDGHFIQTMGRAGRGPGEFQTFKDLKVVGDRLYTLDNILKRVNIFDLDSLKSSHTIILDPKNWENIDNLKGATVDAIYPLNNQQILVAFKEPSRANLVVNGDFDPKQKRYHRYYIMNHRGEIANEMIFKNRETLFGISGPVPSGFNLRDFPFDRNPLIAVTANGTIYSAWTDQFLIKIYSPDGKYARAFYKPHNNSMLNPENLSDFLQEHLDETEVPSNWPAIDNIIVDDRNRIWVSTITDNRKNYLWWVIEENGEVLAKFTWEATILDRHREDEILRLVKDNYLYTIEPSEKYGGEKVVKYQVKSGSKI